jgi:hypothetical protein
MSESSRPAVARDRVPCLTDRDRITRHSISMRAPRRRSLPNAWKYAAIEITVAAEQTRQD